MSQFGMQMPGGQMQRGATMNVFTGLLALAVLALVAACGYVALQGMKISPDGSPFSLQKASDGGSGPTAIEFKPK